MTSFIITWVPKWGRHNGRKTVFIVIMSRGRLGVQGLVQVFCNHKVVHLITEIDKVCPSFISVSILPFSCTF